MIAETEATVEYWMEFKRVHITRVIASDGRVLRNGGGVTYNPDLNVLILAHEGVLKEEFDETRGVHVERGQSVPGGVSPAAVVPGNEGCTE